MKKLNFKVGDVVEIMDNRSSHGFPISQRVEITGLCNVNTDYAHYYATSVDDDEESWWISDDEVRAIASEPEG